MSSATRVSHQRAMSSACRLVSEAANLQPMLPVQATRPARTELASVERPSGVDGGAGEGDLVVGHAGDQQVLPHGEADVAVAQVLGRSWRGRASARATSRPTYERDADPVEARLLLACARRCGRRGRMRGAAGSPRAARASACGRASPRRGRGSARCPMASSTYLRRALVRSVRSPWSMKTRTTASATAVASAGLHDDAGLVGEVPVPGDAAQQDAEPDARLDTEAALHLHGLEADVVGVLQHGDGAGAVEADVELARQAVERAVVEDVEVPLAGVGPRVDQLLRVDAGGGRAGDVADVVGAGAARARGPSPGSPRPGRRRSSARSRASAGWRAW